MFSLLSSSVSSLSFSRSSLSLSLSSLSFTRLYQHIHYYFTTETEPLFAPAASFSSTSSSSSSSPSSFSSTLPSSSSSLSSSAPPLYLSSLPRSPPFPSSVPRYVLFGLGNYGSLFVNTRHNAGRDAVEGLAQRYGAPFIEGKKVAHCKHTRPIVIRCGVKEKEGEAKEEKREGEAEREGEGSKELILACPESFMNTCGPYIASFLSIYSLPIENTIVIYDDKALPLGQFKIRQSGGAGGHNGVRSLLGALPRLGIVKSKEIKGAEDLPFVRIRMGIGDGKEGRGGGERGDGGRGLFDLKDFVLGKWTPEERGIVEEMKRKVYDIVEMIVRDGADAAANHFNGKKPKDKQVKRPFIPSHHHIQKKEVEKKPIDAEKVKEREKAY